MLQSKESFKIINLINDYDYSKIKTELLEQRGQMGQMVP
jgi:hypothetical protein